MSELNDIPSALQAPLPATLARWTCTGWAKKARLMTIIDPRRRRRGVRDAEGADDRDAEGVEGVGN